MDKGVELFKMDKVKFLIATGGRGKLFNLTSRPLGEVSKEYLIKKGVGEEKILPDNKSVNTYENAKFSLALMKGNSLSSGVVITSVDHMVRARKIFKEVFPKNIKIDFVISDYFSGLWSLWDILWHAAGWVKYLIKKRLNK